MKIFDRHIQLINWDDGEHKPSFGIRRRGSASTKIFISFSIFFWYWELRVHNSTKRYLRLIREHLEARRKVRGLGHDAVN